MSNADFEVVAEFFRCGVRLICGSFVGSQVACTEEGLQIVNLPKNLPESDCKAPHGRLFQELRKEFWKDSGHGVSTDRFFVEGLKASQGHSSVEIVSHKLDSGAWSQPFGPSTFVWPRLMAAEPWLDRANGSRAFAWPELLAPHELRWACPGWFAKDTLNQLKQMLLKKAYWTRFG